MVIQSPYVASLDAETGDVIDAQAINMSSVGPSTPKGVTQVGDEIWVSDQNVDAVFRFDMDGNHLGTITGAMDNIKGLGVINNSEVWVTNAGAANGAPGDALVRLDLDGNSLGFYATAPKSAFDVLDTGSDVLISFIDNGSPVERWDYDGNFIDYVVAPNHLNFAQQLSFTASGDLLVANFSSPSGIYLFDPNTGDELEYWSQSGVRGAIETGDGSILWSNSSGVYRMNPATGSSVMLLSGSAQFFAKIGESGGGGSGCTTPTLSVTPPEAICEGFTATIDATTNGEEVRWYESQTATSAIATGTSFTTPALTQTTSYWAQAVNFGDVDLTEITGGARLAPTNTSSAAVVSATSPWGLSFNTQSDFVINSVDVYLAGAPGTLVMQLLDENWALIEETTVSTPAGNSANPVQFEVPLDFEVEANKTYRLVASASPEMIREFSGSHDGFPYFVGDDVATITGGTINNSHTNDTVYYFFYNWTVTAMQVEECLSSRKEVVVEVNPTPNAPVGDAEQQFNQGETLADLEVEATGDLTWYEDANGTVVLPETTQLVDQTTYYVSQTIDGCESDLLAITVYLSLGATSFDEYALHVYPNPVSTMLYINSEKPIGFVEIYDVTGRRLNRILNPINKQIDFSSFSDGAYLLKIKAGKELQTITVLKE